MTKEKEVTNWDNSRLEEQLIVCEPHSGLDLDFRVSRCGMGGDWWLPGLKDG